MQKLYFIRHGLSVMNAQNLFAGSTDTPLTTEGRKQALLASHIAKDLDIDLIVCSPLSRALDTAKIIAQPLNYPANTILVNDLFVERACGSLEGTPWYRISIFEDVADVEKSAVFMERAQKGADFLQNLDADNVLVVSHGGYGRALRKVLLPNTDYTEIIPNAQIINWI